MGKRVLRSSRVLAVVAVLVAVVSASALTGWITVGSAGTVDEDSASIVSLQGSSVGLRTSCVLAVLGVSKWCSVSTGTVTVRYNVVPTGALNDIPPASFGPFRFHARFRDTGSTQRVLLSLREVNLQSGAENTLVAFDSDSISPSPNYQTQQGPNPCQFTFNFDDNAYYVEARITNSADTGASPELQAIWIDRCSTF